MKLYQELCARKRRLADDSELQRGKPLLLGSQVDKAVQLYILKFREQGGEVNSVIVQATSYRVVLIATSDAYVH